MNLRLLGRISDNEFAAALTNALCLLFPSRMEGFGIPMTEAMALGLPSCCVERSLHAGGWR